VRDKVAYFQVCTAITHNKGKEEGEEEEEGTRRSWKRFADFDDLDAKVGGWEGRGRRRGRRVGEAFLHLILPLLLLLPPTTRSAATSMAITSPLVCPLYPPNT